MSVARLRALTHLYDRVLTIYPCRNERCPFEGIDTSIFFPFILTDIVEMSVARLRALTLVLENLSSVCPTV